MKLVKRQSVVGTYPVIYIGHRTYRDRHSGRERVSKRWYAEYCVDAEHRYEALKTTKRDIAVKRAYDIIRRIEGGQPNKPRRVAIADLVDRYLETARDRGRAPRTIQKYKHVLGILKEWVTSHGPRTAAAFDETAFWKFSRHLRDERKLAEKTSYDYLVIVKQATKWATRAKLLASNPLQGISLDKPARTTQPCFTQEQVATLLSQADPHEGAIFAVMAYAGLRFGEVCDLRWQDLLLGQGTHGFILVQRGGSSGLTKNRRPRRIPINPELRSIIDQLPVGEGRIFHARPSAKHPDGDGPINERRLLMSLKRLCKRCGFANPNQYKLHTFRHVFASMCARNNISYKYALEWMGHRSSEILDLYYTMFDDVAEAAMATISYTQSADPEKKPAA